MASPVLGGIVAFLGLLVITSGFALLTPLSASPDEPDHWRQAYGVWSGQASPFGGQDGSYLVPEYMAGYLGQCTYQEPSVAADCIPEVGGSELVEGFSSMSDSPPAFYALVGWVTRIADGAPALYGMRIVAAALFSMIAAATVALLLTARGWRLHFALLLGLTPSVYFLAGTFNPTGVEVAAIGLVCALAWRWFREPIDGSHRLWFVLLCSAVAFAGLLQPLSMLMVAVALAGVSVAAVPRSNWRIFALKLGGVAAGMLVYGLIWILFVRGDGSSTAQDSSARLLEFFAIKTTLWKGLGLPSEWVGLMGWLDTGSNSVSTAAWGAAIGIVMLPLVGRVRQRYWFGIIVVVTSLVVIWLLLDNYLSRVGPVPFWQARYGAPLVLVVFLLIGLSPGPMKGDHRLSRPMVRAAVLIAGAVVVAASVMVVRYGWGPAWDGPWYPARWLPFGDDGWLTMLALLLVVAGVVGVAIGPLLVVQLRRRGRTAEVGVIRSEPPISSGSPHPDAESGVQSPAGLRP